MAGTKHAEVLKAKIDSRKARIGVIGLGYAGLPLATLFAEAGFRVTGIDTDPDRVESVTRGVSHIPGVASQQLKGLSESGFLSATDDYAVLAELDAVSICVPTPLSKTREPDISYVVEAAGGVAKNMRSGQLIVLESTTYPGTTEELILPRLQSTGLRVGEEFFLAFSPERIDPGNAEYSIGNTPKVVAGITPKCSELAQDLYGTVIERLVPVSTTRCAETVKLLENTFRYTNLAMVNELAIMCGRLGVDVWEVIEAAGTKPFGFMSFLPGPGLGGHCIPVDPLYLSWKLKTLNYTARFIELAGQINADMPNRVFRKIVAALNEVSKSVNNSRILILGVAYKKDVSDTRESPALDIMRALLEKGAILSYVDPFVPQLELESQAFHSLELDAETLEQFDCAVIVADHSRFDYDLIVSRSKLVVDTRNATGCVTGDKSNVVGL
jgi:UDP-N-acetyl-D-glucosamine dehydrogenase